MKKYILTIGNTMIDIYGHAPKETVVGCEMGNVKVSYGGVGRNIVENLLRIEVPTKYISVFGNDLYGGAMKKQLIDLKGDLSASIQANEPSATFMGILNEKNQLLSAIADSKITRHLTLDYLLENKKLIDDAEYIIFDSNDYDLYDAFFSTFKNKKVIIDPVSPVKAKKIKHFLPFIHTIKPNQLEAESLCGFKLQSQKSIHEAGSYFLNLGVKHIFITLGEEGVYYNDGKEEGVMSVKHVTVNNEIGAGDSFVAGIGYGYLNDFNFIDTVKFSYAMAINNLLSDETVNPKLNQKSILSIYKNTKWVNQPF